MALGDTSKSTQNKLRKVCIVCGADFFVFPCLRRVQCCSRSCRAKFVGQKLIGKSLPKTTRACKSCGAPFESLRSFYCVPCRKKIRREYMKQEMRRRGKDPVWAKRLRAYTKVASDNAQADPERRRRRNMRAAQYEARRRAMIKGTRIGRVSYVRLLHSHGMFCYLCRSAISDGELSFDHVVPLVRGGAHTEDNLRPAHILCNRRKNCKLLEELQWR